MTLDADRRAIAFAERVLVLLDEGAFTTTYKYAVLLGLMDLCFEHSTRTGAAPSSVTTGQLAAKVVELYWPHATPFAEGGYARVLMQGQTGRGDAGQAAIVSSIDDYRRRHALDVTPFSRARSRADLQDLVRRIEWILVRWPLPRLQKIGQSDVRFIYEITWGEEPRKRDFEDPKKFDNVIRFQPRVGDYLVRLAGLLRPLIQRQWAAMVARRNDFAEAKLQEFLFGADRTALAPVRGPLRELQQGRCFYCDGRLRDEATVEVDHFVPWARYPNNALENLVVADHKCNNNKREHLAAAVHVARWSARNRTRGGDLADIAAHVQWEHAADRSLAVARAIYLRLPDEIRLWRGRADFEALDRDAVATALGSVAP